MKTTSFVKSVQAKSIKSAAKAILPGGVLSGVLLTVVAANIVWAQDVPQNAPVQQLQNGVGQVTQPTTQSTTPPAPDQTAQPAPPQGNNVPPYPPQYPQAQYPQAQYPQSQYPQSQYPQGYPPQGQGFPQGYPQQGYPQQAYQPPPLPAQLTLQAGTFITVRVNQVLSSDHNHAGDVFTASLVKPVVVDGVVVADRGQTLAGRVSEAEKAGMVKGVSKLGVELTNLNLIDGTPSPLKTSLVNRSGPTTVGRDAAAIGGTTALGAATGAVADLGRGAAIGAGAGAAVGTIGVLLTRGRPTLIYPEMVLTFRIENPITISTARAPQAFRFVGPGDYDQPQDRPRMMARPGPYYGGVYGGYPYPYYGYPYYPYYPYYWGPGFGIRFGGRWR